MPLTVAAPSSAMYYHRTPRRPHPRIPPPQPPPPVLHCLCFAVACMLLVQPGSAHPAHRRLPDLTSSTSTKSLPPTPKILSNVNLTCCVLVKYPYVFPIPASSSAIPSSFSVSFPTSNTNNNTDQLYDGWTIRNFRHLASKTGLSCGTSFVLPAATWTEKSIISELSLCRDDYRKCNCTFVIGAFSERGKTHGQVKFLPDNGFDRVVVLTRVENTQNSQSSGIIFGAFDPTVWAAIVMLMGMYTVLKMLDTRFSPAVRASARYCEHDDGQGGRRMEGNSRYNYDRGVNGHGQVERQRSQRLLQECQQQQGQQRQQQQQHEQRQQEEQQAVTAAKSIGRRMKRWRNVVMKSRFFYRLRKSIQSTVGLMLGYSRQIDGEDKSTRMWVINVSIVLSGLFLVLVYEASMVARLVKEDGTASSYVSRKNLAHCDIPDKRICMLRDSWEHQFWIDSMLDQECRSGNNTTSPILASDVPNLLDNITHGPCEYMLADGPLSTSILNSRCGSIVQTGDLVVSRSMGFIVPLSSPYQDQLSLAILQIMEYNQFPSLQAYLQDMNTCDRVMLPTLSFRRLESFFVIVFVACLVVVGWMMVDRQTPLPGE